ncbi:MAG: protein TolQ [Gammaproteobacteria bacterium]|jgi:biopolymer transport protein TolQ|nr:protein TolQ [Gammaproteobacteria bacterium]
MNDLSILRLILEATLIVQLVMLLLVGASVFSWSVIFRKRSILATIKADLERFESEFWASGDLGALYRGIDSRGASRGIESIFRAGFREFARLKQQGNNPSDTLLEGARRAMKAQQIKEMEHMEHSLSALATVGSTSPYVGLFGTVWGIMHAFIGLGSVQQASLQTVAPGIAEALIATAMGLFAAIPAVIAYNRFADQVWRLEMRFDAFIEEFSTILQRHASRGEH